MQGAAYFATADNELAVLMSGQASPLTSRPEVAQCSAHQQSTLLQKPKRDYLDLRRHCSLIKGLYFFGLIVRFCHQVRITVLGRVVGLQNTHHVSVSAGTVRYLRRTKTAAFSIKVVGFSGVLLCSQRSRRLLIPELAAARKQQRC